MAQDKGQNLIPLTPLEGQYKIEKFCSTTNAFNNSRTVDPSQKSQMKKGISQTQVNGHGNILTKNIALAYQSVDLKATKTRQENELHTDILASGVAQTGLSTVKNANYMVIADDQAS